jgi:hypothetical protein
MNTDFDKLIDQIFEVIGTEDKQQFLSSMEEYLQVNLAAKLMEKAKTDSRYDGMKFEDQKSLDDAIKSLMTPEEVKEASEKIISEYMTLFFKEVLPTLTPEQQDRIDAIMSGLN